jgi:hypothetical protein
LQLCEGNDLEIDVGGWLEIASPEIYLNRALFTAAGRLDIGEADGITVIRDARSGDGCGSVQYGGNASGTIQNTVFDLGYTMSLEAIPKPV